MPQEQVEAIKRLSGNVSAFLTDAAALSLRRHAFEEGLREYEAAHGIITEDEMDLASAAGSVRVA